MVRVIIADSDEENRKNFKTYIKTVKKDFNVVKAILPGEDVFLAINESSAQLLIADIRFFGPASIVTINKIHSLFPEIQIFLYGTYNDAVYLEKTAEQGRVTYMFKPVKPAELGRNMDRIYKELKKNEIDLKAKEKLISSYNRSLSVFEDRLLINLVHGQLYTESEFSEAVEYFNFKLIPPYRVFIVEIDSFRQISLALDQNEKQMLVFQMLTIVNKKLSALKNGIAFINHISSVTAIFGGDIEFEDFFNLLDNIKDEINRVLKISISIGAGRPYERGTEIQVSYKQAKSALRYRHVVGEYSVIPIDFVEPLNILTYKYPHKKEELLTYSAVVGDLEKTNMYLNDIFKALRGTNDIPEKLIPNIIVDIAISINRYVSEQKNIDQNVLAGIFTLKDALNIKTIDEGYSYLKNSLTQLCINIENARRTRELVIIDKVKQHVENVYFENISLTQAAKNFGLVPEYLNRIFMNHENHTYYDVVMSKRITVAKQLLERDDLDDQTIAVSIGYSDANYFRSTFLQYEGISTAEYRDLYNRGALNA